MEKKHSDLEKDSRFGLLLNKDTLITSKTDTKGVITYCNQDFMLYSGYNEDELIDAPHNIVRHKDMPKCVFKVLWDYIQSGKEIFAFVKNRTKFDEFYWVFTNITPSYDKDGKIIGYYSVRRKPNLNAIPTIEGLYKNLVSIESASGMNESLKALVAFIESNKKPYNQIVLELQD